MIQIPTDVRSYFKTGAHTLAISELYASLSDFELSFDQGVFTLNNSEGLQKRDLIQRLVDRSFHGFTPEILKRETVLSNWKIKLIASNANGLDLTFTSQDTYHKIISRLKEFKLSLRGCLQNEGSSLFGGFLTNFPLFV